MAHLDRFNECALEAKVPSFPCLLCPPDTYRVQGLDITSNTIISRRQYSFSRFAVFRDHISLVKDLLKRNIFLFVERLADRAGSWLKMAILTRYEALPGYAPPPSSQCFFCCLVVGFFLFFWFVLLVFVFLVVFVLGVGLF